MCSYYTPGSRFCLIGRDYFDSLAEDEVGFVAKILRSLRRSKKHENVVFWAYHFLECFVRGLNPYIQIYYTACGLLKELIDSVLTFKPDTPSMIVQITFDLMGEVTKFNLFNLTAMDRMLIQEGKSQDFYKLVDKNLVDSNVFIRSLLQSEFYRNTLGKENLRTAPARTVVHSRGARRARGAHFGARGCPSSSAMPELLCSTKSIATPWLWFSATIALSRTSIMTVSSCCLRSAARAVTAR